MGKKIFIFTGKGGVGKSSISSTHAIVSSRKNIKTLLISMDLSHSLSDIFAQNFEHDITKIEKNLYVSEFDSSKILEEKFPNLKKFLANNFKTIDFTKINYTSSLDMPFVVNILSLIKILDIYENSDFENIIVDFPASSSAFTYLKIPDLFSWYMEKFFGSGKAIIRTLRPISKYKYKINLPDGDQMDELYQLYYRILSLQKILKDKTITTIRLVTLAEKIVIEEVKRDFSYLKLYDYNVDRIFVNKLIEEENNNFIKKRVKIQEKYIEQIKSIFYYIDIDYLPMIKKDMKNSEDLEEFVKYFEKIDNLLDIKQMENSEIYFKDDDYYVLSFNIGEFYDIYIRKIDGDIYIIVDNVKRIIRVPDVLIDSYIHHYEKIGEDLFIYLKSEEKYEEKL